MTIFNFIIVIIGANNLLTPQIVNQQMSSLKHHHDIIQINKRTIILSQLEIPIQSTFEAMKIGHQWGATTILNPAPCNTQILHYHNMLHYVDIIIPNQTELQQLVQHIIQLEQYYDQDCTTGTCAIGTTCTSIHSSSRSSMTEQDMAKLLLDQGIRQAVIVTLGARGAMIVSKQHNNNADNSNNTDSTDSTNSYETIMVQAPPELDCHQLPVVDTVGAGDSFCGSLSMYLSCGLNLKDAAIKACGVASMSVRKRGAQSSYPSANELPPILRITDL